MTEAVPDLLLIGHGSRSTDGADEFRELVPMVREAMDHAGFARARIGAGFLEFAEPHVDDALDSLVAEGARHVVAVPVVLLAAGHLKNDGPDLLQRARLRHPAVTFDYGRDLGVHSTTLEIATEMASETLARIAGKPFSVTGTSATVRTDASAVILVGRGSTDPDANSDLYKVARLLSDGRGLPLVEPAFVSLAPPSVAEALERARRLGADRIAVVPYFLFSGVLSERIAGQAAAWASDHPGIAVTCTGAMGPDDRLARLIVERYSEGWSGPAAMNCDCCIYRTPFPGYESRAGARTPAHEH